MKVVAFNGSARKNGNTAILVNRVFQELQKEGIETEMVQLSGEYIRGCIACYKCFENKDQRCSVTNDVLNSCVVGIPSLNDATCDGLDNDCDGETDEDYLSTSSTQWL